MNILDIFFTILIKPLELIFEAIFALSHNIMPSPAVNLVIMSLAINFLVLPLYRRADIIQMETRDKEAKLRPMVDHIRKSFKGDEKVMMLQTYYDQQHYHPLSSLKSIISLLLQIPFFIAAYQFLSHLPALQGQSMGPIADLATPDGLLVIGGITINVLPIIMTVVNIVSSEIYMKGQPFKSKIVLYLSALVFLVLLYDSPSGLVFYWTFNNVFSLVKNIFYKLKNPGFVFMILCAVSGAVGLVLVIINRGQFQTNYLVFLIDCCVLLMAPIVLHFVFRKRQSKEKAKEKSKLSPAANAIYWISAAYMSILTGLLIPSAVISSSPDDFIKITSLQNPAFYTWYTLCVAIGVFLVWVSVFYLLSDDNGRKVFSVVMLIVSVASTVNYLFFGTKLGTLSPELELDNELKYQPTTILINLGIMVAVAVACYLLHRFVPQITRYVLLAFTLVAFGMGIFNVAKVYSFYNEVAERAAASAQPQITLSRNGKNVVVIMLDRALNQLVPYLFNENRKLNDQFAGFTYYPNTISYGAHTNFAAPSLFGGYEYTPEKLNARADERLVDKHNEALLVMPRIFSNEGFTTGVMDIPYVNYREITDTSIFDEYENINAYAGFGVLNPYNKTLNAQSEMVRKRNFFCYSIFKTAPVFLQSEIYDKGSYNSLNVNYDDIPEAEFTTPQKLISNSEAVGIKAKFLDAYYALEAMPSITNIVDTDTNCFFAMDNDTAHEQTILQTPDYVPSNHPDNRKYDSMHAYRMVLNGRYMGLSSYMQISHYEVNMAAYNSLGRWFDYLRQEGVWDNTRIIIVSDHGYNIGHFPDMVFKDFDLEYVNALLMVKDFGATEFTTSNDFMTVADVPTLATSGVIDNPVNPFSGRTITNAEKFEGPVNIILSEDWKVTENNGNTFLPGKWYSVYDNIFDESNWKYLGEY